MLPGHGRATETIVKVPASAFEPDATALKIIGLLREYYVLTDKIEPLVAALERRRLDGAYRGLQDRATCASVLTDDLRAASGDGHLTGRCTKPASMPMLGVLPGWTGFSGSRRLEPKG